VRRRRSVVYGDTHASILRDDSGRCLAADGSRPIFRAARNAAGVR
jgi:hypothetical protein